jgi:hypothetical protein
MRPNEAVTALLDSRDCCSVADRQMVFGLCQKLRRCQHFQRSIAAFAEWADDRSKFLGLIEFKPASNWREKIGVLQQCIELVPFLGGALAEFAIQFAQDGVAIVRDRSVELWVAMIRADRAAMAELDRLMEKGWQTRLIVAKIVAAVGVTKVSEGIAQRLSRDEVRNVRFCLAAGIRKSDAFKLLFAAAQDPEILAL